MFAPCHELYRMTVPTLNRVGFVLPGFVKKTTMWAAATPDGCRFAGGLMDFDLRTYFPIFLYLAFIVAVVIASMVLAHTVGPRRNTPVKLMPYESGMDPIGDARQRFDVKFYLVAIMFLVFDVELLFLYPWAVVAYHGEGFGPVLSRPVLWSVLVFIDLLFIAYVYDWRMGVF